MSGEVTDNHKVVFMFEFVAKLSEISSNTKYFSPACVVRNLRWRIVIEKKSTEEGEFEYVDAKDTLAVKIQCDGESKMWCTYAKIRLTLISQKEQNYCKEFENLFSSLSPDWGYSDFMEWDKVVDLNNGYVNNNVLKIQAYVVADIPVNASPVVEVDLPEHYEDWLALFEKNLNDKIVGRISCEFVRMNNVIEKAVKNEEISEKLISSAINPINEVISTEIQALEKKLEKFCRTHIAKVISELKNIKLPGKLESEANGVETNDDDESKKSCSGQDMKKVSNVEEETVPVSALKIMKELIIEQQRTSFGWLPNMYGARAAYYRNEIHSFKPDSLRESEDFGLQKEVLKPLTYEKGTESKQQPEDMDADISISGSSSENRESINLLHGNQKNEQLQKKREDVENHFYGILHPSNKPIIVQEEVSQPTNQMEEEILFCGKSNDGGLKVHKVSHRQQLEDLKKKYKSFKLLKANDFQEI